MNDKIYTRCPRAIYLESFTASYLVRVWDECRNSGVMPAPGPIHKQTQFTVELFNFLDELLAKQRSKEANSSKSAKKPTKK